jgi:hypothetical protein
VVHKILVREETPTRALASALVPAPRQGVACVWPVESYLKNLRDDMVRVVRVELRLSVRLCVRGLMRLHLRVDDAS